ncbi:SDR family oxidoreductase [Bdellovibrio bacteriovorus]
MKKVLIVGATSAIAQEVARVYAAEKANLFLLGRNRDFLEIIKDDLLSRGASSVDYVSHNLNDHAYHETLVNNATASLGHVDVALVAHGILGDQEKAESDTTELLNILNSNFVSHASIISKIAQKMKERKSGTIAVISSVAGDRGKQSNYIYGSAQAAKSAFTDGLRNRLFPYNVQVITLKLGFVDTPMTKNFKKGALWASPSAIAKGICEAIDKKKDSVYLPFFWRYIMMIFKSVPEGLFKKLKL